MGSITQTQPNVNLERGLIMQKTKLMAFRFTEDERRQIERIAKRQQVSLSSVVRDAVQLLAEREGGSNALPVGKGESGAMVVEARTALQ